MEKLLGYIIVIVLIGGVAYAWCSVLNFLVETPKRLKRIADAMERRNKYGN